MASIKKSPGRFKFGVDPERYEAARPGYPEVLYDWLADNDTLTGPTHALEIGAGTGHATRAFLSRGIKHIHAIDPDPRLCAHLNAACGADPRLTIEATGFEDVEAAPGTYDLVVAATSFHWLPRMKALTKVLTLLKLRGHFAMWWNVYDDPAQPDAFGKATAHLFVGLEQGPKAAASKPFALDTAARLGEMRKAGFADTIAARWDWPVSFTPDQIADLYATFSRVQIAPEATRARLLAEVKAIAQTQFGGQVTRTIATSAYLGRKPVTGTASR